MHNIGKMMRLTLMILLISVTLMSQAAVYKWIDKDGNAHYSDEPVNNSQVVQFKSNTQNQVTPLPPQSGTMNSDTQEELAPSTKYTIGIQSPQEEATIRDNNGDITIMAAISPNLSSGDVLVILMDDKVMGNAQTTPIFSLKNIPRGEHTFIIKAVAQNGRQLASSSPRKIYLHRAIVNNSRKPTPYNKGG
ncbi:DUF4124 domain-containing protein [Shewanella hanedai]|jgi:hypothetical protein|nr:DUF4124 domain-containing protein [Shewanella hanedai]